MQLNSTSVPIRPTERLFFSFKLLILVWFATASALAQAQTTYTWTGTADTDWSNGTNWVSNLSLPRTVPLNTDILIFSSGGTLTITNVPTQTIGQLLVSNNTIVNLQAVTSPSTLTLSGGPGVDLDVAAGSALNINGVNNLNIFLSTGTTGSVSGSMSFSPSSASHTLDAAAANAIIFNNGAVFTQDCSGNVFTSNTISNTVIFDTGSKFVSRSGGNPFDLAAPASKVSFKTGSLYSHQQNFPPSLSGRTYADFEINSAAYNRFPLAVGTAAWTVDNLIVTATGGPTGFGVDLIGGINIKGNLLVNGGTITFSPALANNLNFNGTGTQIISGTGTLNINSNTNVTVATGSTLEIKRNSTFGGNLTVNGTLQFDASTARTLSITGNTSGTGTVNMSGGNLAHVLNLAGAQNAIGSLVTGPASSTVNYNGSMDQQVFASANYRNLTISGSGIKSMQGNVTVNNTAAFQGGTLSIGSNTLTLAGTVSNSGGSLTGGSLASLNVVGTSTPVMYLPPISNGLLNLSIAKSGSYKNIYLSSNTTLYNGGTLQLQDGYFNANGKALVLGENSSAIVNVIRNVGVLESTPLITGKVNLTYTATTYDYFWGTGTGNELPGSATALNNLTVNTNNIVVTLRSSPTVNGTLTLAGNANTKLALNNQTLTIAGDYVRGSGVFVGSPTASLVMQGSNKSLTGTLTFDQASQANRSLQNLTLNLTGTSPALTLDSHCEISSLSVASGTLNATGSDVYVTTASIGASGKFNNSSAAFPAVLPGSTSFRAFNNQTLAFVNKFDAVAVSNNTGNSILATNTDFSFTRGGGGNVYAVRANKSFNPIPTAAMVTFQVVGTNNGTATPTAGTLYLGSNLGDNSNAPTGAASLQFNLTAANNKVSVTNGSATSIDNNANQTFTWIVNPTAGSINYTSPAGDSVRVGAISAVLWLGNNLISTTSYASGISALQQVKFLMNGGNGSIQLINLRINPLSSITTNTFANTCITPGGTIDIPYSLVENTSGTIPATQAGGLANRAQSLNEGAQIQVILSDAKGLFAANLFNSTILNKISSTNPLLLSGTVQVQIPLWATGGGYRYRVVVDENISNTPRPNAVSSNASAPYGQRLFTTGATASMYYVSPSTPQSFLINQTGTLLTVNTPTPASSYQWYYQRADDLTNTKIAITGATAASYAPKGIDFGTQGTYNVFCQVNFGSCSSVLTNEVQVDIVCSSGTNIIANGDFNNFITGSAQNVVVTKGTSKISGTGTMFRSELRPGRKLYSYDNTYLGTVVAVNSDTDVDVIYPNLTKGNITYNSTQFRVNYTEIPLQGTITVTAGSTSVSGTNSQFQGQLAAGYNLYTNAGILIGKISSISDNNSLVLQSGAAVGVTNGLYKTDANDFLYPGTISASTSSAVVTGVNTTFTTTNGGVVKQIQPGDIIRIIDKTNSSTIVDIGTVKTVDSPTQVTLTTTAKATVSSAYYVANPSSFGNTGMQFDAEYRYSSWNLYPNGNYAVGDNPNYYNANFCTMTATTQNSASIGGSGGNMLIGNAGSSTQMLWSQVLNNIQPNTNYVLTFNATSLSGSTTSLAFGAYINCNRVGNDITSNYTSTCQWSRYTILINSGSLSSFRLSIGNISTLTGFNDIAIDDINLFICPNVVTVPFPSITQFQWRGYNSNWFNADNWGTCSIPSCGDNITIPSGLTYYPVISSADAQGQTPVAGTVSIYPNASLTINPDINLNICGDVINNGSFNALTSATSKSKVTFIGYGSAMIQPTTPPTRQTITTTATSPFADVVVNQYPIMSGGVTLNSNATINGQLDIKSGNTLVLNTSVLTLNGTVSSSTGTLTGSNSSGLVINGTGDLGGPLRFNPNVANGQNLAYLNLNRISTGRVTLGTPLYLIGGKGTSMNSLARTTDALWLQNGLINTSSNNVLAMALDPATSKGATVVNGTSFVSGGSNTSHINGPMAKVVNAASNFTFPVGDAGFLGEIGITPTSTTATVFTGQYYRKDAYTVGNAVENPPLDHVSHMEYWTLDRSAYNGSASVTDGRVTLHWTDYSLVSALASDWKELRIARYDALLKTWQNRGPGGKLGTNVTFDPSVFGATYTKGYVTSDVVSNFSPFTLASTIPNNPLPVELVNLKATPKGSTVDVSWVTATERNGDYFEVQRSLDGKSFISIGKIKAVGESATAQVYRFIDTNPAGFNYYRLKSVDKDGKNAFSEIVTAQLTSVEKLPVEVFPNPFDGKAIYVRTSFVGNIIITVTNVVGLELYRYSAVSGGEVLSLHPNLSSGTYVLTVRTGQQISQHKIVVK